MRPYSGAWEREPMSHTVEAARLSVDPQRRRALERANEIRLARAELKRNIAEGEVLVGEVLLDVPHYARSLTVWDLLISQRRWGASRCRKFLWRNHITETKPLGALTERQRRMLATQLDVCSVPGLALVEA